MALQADWEKRYIQQQTTDKTVISQSYSQWHQPKLVNSNSLQFHDKNN